MKPLKVFLCHAHADKSAVRSLYRHLKERKIDVWLDAEKILPGQNWQVEIPKALASSDVVIICLSKNSVDKEGYVQKEIKFALDKALEMPEGRIFLIPARLEECDLPYSLSAFHFVNLFEEDGYKRLLRSLRARAEQIGATKVEQITNVPHQEESKDNSIDVGGDVKGANIIMGNSNVIHVTSQPIDRVSNPTITQDDKERRDAIPIYKDARVVESETIKQESRKLPFWGIGLIAFAILAFSVWGLSSIPASPKLTQTPSATQILFVESATKTSVPATSTATIIPTPVLSIGSTIIGKDGATLAYVTAGKFTTGSYLDKRIHIVYLDAFWINQTEVTNAMYAKCVDAGACEPPINTNRFKNSKYANHPVVYVDWNKAKTYCEWAGGGLPTEAQWEKAARGTDARTYPWGEGIDCDKANYRSSCVGATLPVGSYESGKSPYEVYDMAGNVSEWVNDYYLDDYHLYGYYATLGDNISNPQGPKSGDTRVIRGGSWVEADYADIKSRSDLRLEWQVPSFTSNYIGFRCSRSVP